MHYFKTKNHPTPPKKESMENSLEQNFVLNFTTMVLVFILRCYIDNVENMHDYNIEP